MSCSSAETQTFVDIPEALRRLVLFKGVSDETLARFSQEGRLFQYPKGKLLYLQDDEAKSFYLIVRGWVKLFRETIEGTEAVIDVLTNGHLLGKSAVFNNGLHGASAECVEEVQLISFPIRLLKQAIEEDPKLALNMLTSMSAHRRQQGREIEHLNIQNAPQRIGCFLLRLCPLNKETEITLHLPYDKTLIAARLGMKPETFSRALAKLKGETGIHIHGSTVKIHDMQALVSYTCSHCSSTFPCEDLKG